MSTLSHSQVLAIARDRFLKRLAKGPSTFTDAIRGLPLPEGTDGRMFGGMVAEMHRDGVIEPVGFAASSVPAGHSRVWRLVDHLKGAK